LIDIPREVRKCRNCGEDKEIAGFDVDRRGMPRATCRMCLVSCERFPLHKGEDYWKTNKIEYYRLHYGSYELVLLFHQLPIWSRIP